MLLINGVAYKKVLLMNGGGGYMTPKSEQEVPKHNGHKTVGGIFLEKLTHFPPKMFIFSWGVHFLVGLIFPQLLTVEIDENSKELGKSRIFTTKFSGEIFSKRYFLRFLF